MTSAPRVTEAERIRQVHIDQLSVAANDVKAASATLTQTVEAARQSRLSWTQIGNAIGISRQGARQRWGR